MFNAVIHHDEKYILQGHPLWERQPHSHLWRTYLQNNPHDLEQDQIKRRVRLLKSRSRITWPPLHSAYWCTVCAHLSHSFRLTNSPGSCHNSRQHDRPCKLQYPDRAHQGSALVPWIDGIGTIPSAKNCWHGWRGIFSGYPQQDHQLHQWHRCGRT